MIKTIEIVLLPEQAADRQIQAEQAAGILSLPLSQIHALKILKRSIDARSRQVKIRLRVEVFVNEDAPDEKNPAAFFDFKKDVSQSPNVLIAGFGPAGMFAALRLIELGYCPIVLERGKDVRERRRDLAAINKEGKINPDSNYCFGEGGAGTYSDGKLYTRSNKRGDIDRILSILVMHGADPDIRVDAHPHIGTNKLPQLVTAIRKTIEDAGGMIRFNKKLTDILVRNDQIHAVRIQNTIDQREEELSCESLLLATGHSARDIFELLHRNKIEIEAKPFAIGVRIEHPQEIIDRVQYHCDVRGPFLPPASYALTGQANDRGVYSFCMCPGGIIAPAATGEKEIVVNGWSPSKRNNPYANSGMVVSLDEKDFSEFKSAGALAGLRYQQQVEFNSWKAGQGNLQAPAQRLLDFLDKKKSPILPSCSYIPGITAAVLDDVLPQEIIQSLRSGIKIFGKKMPAYLTNEAVLVATESRTSSPVRIPRDPETLQHIRVKGLFPCAEGAGYAGGIVSAAMDGERCAEAIAKLLK